jgi:hypothetical protein
MALAAPPLSDRKRVKVYELKNNDWYDRGTGFCAGQILAVSWTLKSMHHLPSGNALTWLPQNDEARIFVQSEDDAQRMLLETRISRDDGYQRQQGTLPSPTNPDRHKLTQAMRRHTDSMDRTKRHRHGLEFSRGRGLRSDLVSHSSPTQETVQN